AGEVLEAGRFGVVRRGLRLRFGVVPGRGGAGPPKGPPPPPPPPPRLRLSPTPPPPGGGPPPPPPPPRSSDRRPCPHLMIGGAHPPCSI
ncbi:hypothetical protein, partial [Nocardia cyriacigeorgica]|uniref:hypothetical protein n=1 Tax=Nocardia cyriacigeorgica TaxID=135487 RepID=UPI00245485C1